MGEFFDLTHDARSGIAELVLNQPARLNTMTPAFFPAVRDAVQTLDDAGATRVLVTFTGERLDAARAYTAGLVNAVLPDADALRDHALQLAQSIAANSPLAIAGSKVALNHARDHGTAESLQQMAVLQSMIFDTAEMERAIHAWRHKRPGEFAPLPPAAKV
jgi:enoyl-CoA hydratase